AHDPRGDGRASGTGRGRHFAVSAHAPRAARARPRPAHRRPLSRAFRDLRRDQDKPLVLRRVLGWAARAVRPPRGSRRAGEPRPPAGVLGDRGGPGPAARQPAHLQRRLVPGPSTAPCGAPLQAWAFAGGASMRGLARARLPFGSVRTRPLAYLSDDRAYTVPTQVRTCRAPPSPGLAR